MSSSVKTIVYWDVDGVLNSTPGGMPTKPNPKGFAGWDEWKLIDVRGYPIMYAPQMIDAINDIAARDDVECRWLTTWHQQATDHLSPALGLDGGEWVVVGEHTEMVMRVRNEKHASWWKTVALLEDRVRHPNKSAIWVDDYHDLYVSHADKQSLAKAGVTLVSTNEKAGLKKKQLAELVQMLDNFAR